MIRRLRESRGQGYSEFFNDYLYYVSRETQNILTKLKLANREFSDIAESGDFTDQDLDYIALSYPKMIKNRLDEIREELEKLQYQSKDFY